MRRFLRQFQAGVRSGRVWLRTGKRQLQHAFAVALFRSRLRTRASSRSSSEIMPTSFVAVAFPLTGMRVKHLSPTTKKQGRQGEGERAKTGGRRKKREMFHHPGMPTYGATDETHKLRHGMTLLTLRQPRPHCPACTQRYQTLTLATKSAPPN